MTKNVEIISQSRSQVGDVAVTFTVGRIKRAPVTYSISERGTEWRVHHGNKIIARCSDHAAAVAFLESQQRIVR